ncbi:MAG TPA: calcium-translocating P-type ATPase, PMCA-type [Candidatus Absconditabacterales bacterium]|nr:calcium-translocating P-type ATPase, PMCA-type [Candidatus Absconditabacterales bacterium]HOQ78888.1 calcium-translocating P-type ATPase, PMCA-type [Candidatus Absconditabacterales bacterium]HPK27843.1 calcium-translocating P-type ATPase, PMCA-type [Candidatus Absconditabacterales bacterium]
MYYKKSIEDIAQEFQVDTKIGLTDKQIKENQKKYGLNILTNEKKVKAWKVFLNQFKSFLILVLIAAAVVSIFIGEMVDSIVIISIVILNAILGFVQEYNAEKSIESLKKMSGQMSRVIRNGREILIDSKQLTVGDILVFDAGDKIGADARIIQSISLELAEAVLTGESLPVKKHVNPINQDSALGDQKNMIFAGTDVTKGHGRAIVVSVGMQTEIGKIAYMIQEAPEPQTNLQKDLDKLGKRLVWIILLICVIVFISDVFIVKDSRQNALLMAIALSVAAIPEGLPAVVTVSLGLGVKRLVKKNALMRKLPSVETLGSVNVICTDKTGTLTKNAMTVKHIFVDNKVFDLDGVGYQDFANKDFLIKNKNNENSLREILKIGVLCNNSSINGVDIVGDPTEIALLVSAMKGNIERMILEKEYELIDEIPFDSERKIMTSIYKKISFSEFIEKKDNKIYLYSKGAPEVLLDKCTHFLTNGEVRKLTEKDKKNILSQNKKFAESALRVLGFAYRIVENYEFNQVYKTESGNVSALEENFVFVGLQAMIDPPRVEVKDSIQICKNAGIRVVMITGDNVTTAKAIAEQLGIDGMTMDGVELDKISDRNLAKIIDKIGVFARVSPAHKQRIVTLLKEKGNIVAMTGDGVNDAPALKVADIGLAMGITGTDVSKEASDMILLDDNFATIVNAIYEGRGIYDNIKKFVNYLLSTNFAEVLIIFVSVLLGMPLPLIAIQILMINLVTDGLPALALGIDPVSPDVMHRKPRKLGSKIIDRKMLTSIIYLSILMTIVILFLFFRHYHVDLEQARTGVFVLLVLLEMIRIWMIRSEYKLKFFSNKWLLGAIVGSIALVLLIVYIPSLSKIFHTKALSLWIWIEILLILFVLFIGVKISKFLKLKFYKLKNG